MFPSEGAPSQKSPPALNVQFIKSIPSWPEDAQDCGSTAAALQFAWCSGGLPLFSSCPPSPLLGTRVQPQRKINKLPFGTRQSLRSTSQESRSSQKALQLPVRCRWCKKKKKRKVCFLRRPPEAECFPSRRVRKVKTAKVLKKTSASGYFHERRRRLDGRTDGRTDGAPTEAP